MDYIPTDEILDALAPEIGLFWRLDALLSRLATFFNTNVFYNCFQTHRSSANIK
jgi:hypothetical protein